MKKKATPLVDEYLQSLYGMQEAATDEFFYARLKARMEKNRQPAWTFPLRPAWLIGCLTLLLAINSFVIVKQKKATQVTAVSGSPMQQFAEEYNLNISSSY